MNKVWLVNSFLEGSVVGPVGIFSSLDKAKKAMEAEAKTIRMVLGESSASLNAEWQTHEMYEEGLMMQNDEWDIIATMWELDRYDASDPSVLEKENQ